MNGEPKYDQNTFQFTFGKLLDKNAFGYLLVGYAFCIFGAIAAIAYKLKGYNKPQPKFSQMVNTWEPKNKSLLRNLKSKPTSNGDSEIKENGSKNETEQDKATRQTKENPKTK